jgi:hypothetical protein
VENRDARPFAGVDTDDGAAVTTPKRRDNSFDGSTRCVRVSLHEVDAVGDFDRFPGRDDRDLRLLGPFVARFDGCERHATVA